jgi:hypothetical protein
MSKRFYIRTNGAPPFTGPFTVEDLRREIQIGHLPTDCEIQEAIGQTYGSLKRNQGWIRFTEVFALEGDTTPALPTDPQDMRILAIVLLVAGVAGTLWAFIRLNSIQSQFMRAAGEGDVIAYVALAIGVLAAILGVAILVAPSPTPETIHPLSSPKPGSPTADIASRLRQLQTLRDSNLISEADFQKRKSDILQSI